MGYQSALTQYRLNLPGHFARVTAASRDDDICQRPVKRLSLRHQLFQGLLAVSLLKQGSTFTGSSSFQLLRHRHVKKNDYACARHHFPVFRRQYSATAGGDDG